MGKKKKQRAGHISDTISPTDFILGTKLQHNKVHSMTQVPMTLFKYTDLVECQEEIESITMF